MMRKDRYLNIGFLICVSALLLFMAVSRAVGITYNISLHPDESEFYNGSESLAQSILDPDIPFVEEKEYPEGGYVLQMPFQIIKELMGSSHWFWRASHCWSRISSVVYFVLSAVYGMMILTKFMSRSKLAAILFGLTMCFSLFFIEHSRYGVGDMGSLWLVMATVYHCACALQTKKGIHLVVAFACTGILAAVKYPQLFFVVIPSGTYLYMSGKDKKKTAAGMLAFLLVVLISLLMFSPKAALDPGYFLRVLDREGKAYVTEGTGFNSGGLLNHVISMVLYTLLYSDYPLSFLFVAAFFCKSLKCRTYDNDSDYLFRKLLPAAITVFFAYNLFAKLLVFRTFTPFFGMTALYASEVAGQWYYSSQNGRRIGRVVVIALTCLMVLRGGWLLKITGMQGDDKERFTPIFTAAVDENWNQVTILTPYNVASEYSFAENMDCPEELSIIQTPIEEYVGENDSFTIQPGELVVTGGYEFGLMAPYFVSYEKSLTAESDDIWKTFKEENRDYYVGQIYPREYYWLFGGWIRGGTLSASLIPCNMVYYRST